MPLIRKRSSKTAWPACDRHTNRQRRPAATPARARQRAPHPPAPACARATCCAGRRGRSRRARCAPAACARRAALLQRSARGAASLGGRVLTAAPSVMLSYKGAAAATCITAARAAGAGKTAGGSRPRHNSQPQSCGDINVQRHAKPGKESGATRAGAPDHGAAGAAQLHRHRVRAPARALARHRPAARVHQHDLLRLICAPGAPGQLQPYPTLSAERHNLPPAHAPAMPPVFGRATTLVRPRR